MRKPKRWIRLKEGEFVQIETLGGRTSMPSFFALAQVARSDKKTLVVEHCKGFKRDGESGRMAAKWRYEVIPWDEVESIKIIR